MNEAKAFRPYPFFVAGLLFVALSALLLPPDTGPVAAQTRVPNPTAGIAERAEPALPADGAYFVNDDFRFTIARKYGVTLMRFAGNDEVFVLSVERAPVGGRLLKYDTGEVALAVTGYGAITLYTSTAPGGLPAERTGNGEPITFPVPPMSLVRAQAVRLGQLLEQVTDLSVTFDADWSRLDDGPARYLALDAMRITARALRGICANRANQARLAARLRVVRVVRGDRPGIVLRNDTLTVTIAPVYGLRGRWSSLAVARALMAHL